MISDTAMTINPHDRHLAGSYELLEEIGSGGMGRVWRARRVGDGEIVAVKVISIDDVDADYERRFRREPEIQRGVGHHNIVHLIDWFRVRDRFLLVMEFVDGETLAARIRRSGPLPVPEAVGLLGQLLDGVGHLHELGIIHRDVKPSNILIARDGALKLADFGIARYVWQQRGTMTRHGLGTPEYMSPEQARGDAVDFRSDIYAIGVTFFEMLTGRRPFATPGETPADYMRVIDAVLNAPLPDPRRERPDLPDDLVELLRRSTSKDPEDRPASCAEFRALLDGASGVVTPAADPAEAAPTRARTPGRSFDRSLGELRRYARTDKGRWQAMTILILALIGAVAIHASLTDGFQPAGDSTPGPVEPAAILADLAVRYARFVEQRRPDSLAALYMPSGVEYFGRGGLDRAGLADRFTTSFATRGDDTLALRPVEARLLADSTIAARWLRIGGRGSRRDSVAEELLLRRHEGSWLIARHAGFRLEAQADGLSGDATPAVAATDRGAGAAVPAAVSAGKGKKKGHVHGNKGKGRKPLIRLNRND